MPAGTIVGIAIAVIVVAIVVAVAGRISARTYRLKKRFGPEYDRLVAERASRRLAETELTERERRVEGFTVRDLSSPARALFRAQWADVQELFVDAPAEAIGQGCGLVKQVMRERGYPDAEFGQMLADLSVRHARTLDRFRSAHDTSEKAAGGEASTEDLRIALLDYRTLFDELLGAQALKHRALKDSALKDSALKDSALKDSALKDSALDDSATGDIGNGHFEPAGTRSTSGEVMPIASSTGDE